MTLLCKYSYLKIANLKNANHILFFPQMRLFYKECPKTVENFVVHSREGYYNGHLFHRVIKGFMVQTGDPTGNCNDGSLTKMVASVIAVNSQ